MVESLLESIKLGGWKMILKTEGTFDAAHHLKGYKGQCSNVHGHTWRVIVWVEGSMSQLDDVGILWDFTNLKKILKELDHKDLNETFSLINPTAENICSYILARLITSDSGLKYKARVYESPNSYCEDER